MTVVSHEPFSWDTTVAMSICDAPEIEATNEALTLVMRDPAPLVPVLTKRIGKHLFKQ